MARIGWRGHRVRFPPVFQHFSRKYQHPPTDIAAWHSVHRRRSVFWKSHEKSTKSNSCYWFLYSSKVIYILNSCFQILYMCFLKQYTYLFSVLAYCACVFPVIIHAGLLFFALKHVFSDLLYIPNYDFWIIRMCFLLFCTYLIPVFELSACISWFFAHTRFLFLTSAHVF